MLTNEIIDIEKCKHCGGAVIVKKLNSRTGFSNAKIVSQCLICKKWLYKFDIFNI